MANLNDLGEMDSSPDAQICALERPLCKMRYVAKIVFNTHLLSHVNYYSRYAGNDIRDMHKEFACTLCPFQSDDISEVVTHLESTHSAKYRIEVGSDDERQLTADNNYEKSQFILVLSQKDRPANPLYTRYRYW